MQCYDSNNYWSGGHNVAEYLKRYRNQVNKDCFVHFFDLQGYGSRQTPSGNKLDNVVSGFSEKIFEQILIHENGDLNNNKLPSLEWIRENF
jgi:hypothetical protein